MKNTTRSRAWTTYVIDNGDETTFELNLNGRLRWALDVLWEAKREGASCTTLDHPGSRLSDYVHRLRNMGVRITTHRRPNTGDFPGTHADYELVSNIVGQIQEADLA